MSTAGRSGLGRWSWTGSSVAYSRARGRAGGSTDCGGNARGAPFWKKWLGRKLPSADTIGRVYSSLDTAVLRQAIRQLYERLKRNKALPGIGGLGWL